MFFKYSLLMLCLFSHPLILTVDHIEVDIQFTDLNPQDKCSGMFEPHQLDHVTSVLDHPVGYYDSNGAGLAINDLDDDGDLDIVLANLDGDNAIFWNQANWQFEKQTLPSASPSRSVSIIDVDGDNWLDIVFTQQVSAPLYWHNELGNSFKIQILQGVSYVGYAMNWEDIDRDGDLDLVTGSYDAEMEKLLGQRVPTSGVIYHENRGDRFVATRLVDRSQTLALLFEDINHDGQNDIIVGNDFAVPDQYFSYTDAGWTELAPPAVMTHSTMSFDAADINNDGNIEIIAVDMKPYSEADDIMMQWRQVLKMLSAMPVDPNDPQIMENVMYATGAGMNLENIADDLALDATGWSWSAKFGDLDNDGYEDLYVVNGMISVELFPYLPNDELVEENQAYQNINGTQFIPRMDWGLNSTASGRGMSMGDLDNDGDLDVVINNLLDNAIVYENQLCTGSSIEVDLRWRNSNNTHAIGARIILNSSSGDYRRTVKASSGYLSGDSSRMHIGFPEDTQVHNLQILWPDGKQTLVDNILPDVLIRVIRG